MNEATKECPECGAESRVIDSRNIGGRIIRKRKCVKCGARWLTKERFLGIVGEEKSGGTL